MQNNELLEIVQLAQRANMLNDKRIQKLLLAYKSTQDAVYYEGIIKRIEAGMLPNLINPEIYPLPSKNEIFIGNPEKGFLLLGKSIRNNEMIPFIIPLNVLNQHIALLGRTGSGKTTIIYMIASQSISYGIHCWIFDMKQDYRHLIQLIPELKVIRVGKELKHNPLQPPKSVLCQEWLSVFSRIFCSVHHLLDASSSMLLKSASRLYSDFGVDKGKDSYPTLFDLADYLKQEQRTAFSQDKIIMNRLIAKLESHIIPHKEIYDCSKGFSIDELSKHSVVFELTGLSETEAKAISNWMIFSLYCQRLAENSRENIIKNLIVVDEAKTLFPMQADSTLSVEGYSPISSLLSQSREFGIGFVIGDQGMSLLDSSVYTNTYTKIVMSLGHGKDIFNAGKMLGLNPAQVQYMNKLKTGQAIVRMPHIQNPFMVDFMPFPL